MNNKDRPRRWRALGAATVLAVTFHLLMEWLFFVTKPSFLSGVGWLISFVALLSAIGVVAAPLLLAELLCWAAARLARRTSFEDVFLNLAWAFPALILSLAVLILIDNFTLTLFRFGLRSADGASLAAYEAGVVILLAVIHGKLRKSRPDHPILFLASAAVLLSSTLVNLASLGVNAGVRKANVSPSVSTRPNVLLLSGDGLDADSLSVYGYQRDTTPFLRGLAKDSLVFDNAFANSCSTGGSLSSLLTGKLPTETRLIYPPDILRGEDAYQHLPFLLRSRGYRSLHLSIRHYADPFDLNFQNSFDISNGQSRGSSSVIGWLSGLLGSESGFFLSQIQDRLSERVLKLCRLREIEDVYSEVSAAPSGSSRDKQFVAEFSRFLKLSDAPFFVQIHFLGTHGRRFRPESRVYSSGEDQNADWMLDFYDDSIRDFDGNVEEIVRMLEAAGQLENTLIVVFSDHSLRNKPGRRIPLMIRFPNRERVGRVRENVQLLDVAPTILASLGAEVPAWMKGRPLISGSLDPLHPIFGTIRRFEADHVRNRLHELDPDKSGPPFFTIGRVFAVICQKSYVLDLSTAMLDVTDVPGHTAPCPLGEMPSPEAVYGIVRDHLAKRGFDVASLPPAVDFPVFAQLRDFAARLQKEGIPVAEIQDRAWKEFGEQLIGLYNTVIDGGPPPPQLQQIADWAVRRGKATLSRESGRPRLIPLRPILE